MNIDVIIPVYRPDEKLKKLLLALGRQTICPTQIILVHTEDGCDLSYAKRLCEGICVREIKIKKADFDHGGTRDMAIRKTNADLIVMMTQDAVPADQRLLETLMNVLVQDENIAAAYARQMAGSEDGIIEQYTRQFNYPAKSRIKSKDDLAKLGIKTYFCSDVCAAYRRDVYLELGGFEKNIIFNEDMVYAAKAIQHGYKIAYAAEAIVWHAHNYSGMKQLRRNFDQGVSQAEYPQVFANVKAETEGMKLVKKTAKYLLKKKRPFQIIRLMFQSICKYTGFCLGKNYKKIPEWMIMKLTMNEEYWKRRINEGEK